jgi:prolipoprotein diacylglyceryltransferase
VRQPFADVRRLEVMMTFPYYIHLGPVTLHPHLAFESLAYFIGFRLYLWTRSKEKLPFEQSMWIIVAAVLGAAAGAKALYWLENPLLTVSHWHDIRYLLEGKTIVGGLLGGLIAVEWTKRRIGVRLSTGDDMALPLAVGMCIGRVGCFLTGLSDHTYGTPTSLPIGVDFGDGIPRHPTQLYEIAFLMALGAALLVLRVRSRARPRPGEPVPAPTSGEASGVRSARRRIGVPDGGIFQLFMTGYLLFRFAVDFIKPTPHPYAGLNNIQLACLAGLIYYVTLLLKWKNVTAPPPPTDGAAPEKGFLS